MQDSVRQLRSTTGYYFMQGGGQMGDLIRAKDWSKTPLGDPATWPQSLCTMVSVLLENPFAMYIAWGEEFTQIYNDGYRPILGNTKHPAALGISTTETFAEIWEIIGPMFNGVMNGQAIGFPDLMLPLSRNGYTEECYFDFAYSPIRKENGEVGGVLVTVIETTNKKKAEDALQESKGQLQFAVESTELATWDYNPVTNKFTSNDRLKEWFGLKDDYEIELQHAINSIAADDQDRVARKIEQSLKFTSGGKYDIEFTIVHPVTFKERIVRTKGNAWYDDNKIAYRLNGTIQDITEQALARRKLEQSEEQIRSMVETAPFPIGVYIGEEMKVQFANESLLGIWGKGNDVFGKSFKQILPEFENQEIFKHIDAVYLTGVPYHTKNQQVDIVRDGKTSRFYFNYSFTPLTDAAGKIYGVMSFAADVTDLNIAKLAIQKSEENLRGTILQAPVAMCILRGENFIVELANDRMFELWGKSAVEVMHKPIFEGLPEAKDQGFEEILHGVYTTGKTFSADGVPITLPRNGDIEIVYVNFVYEPYRNADGIISGILAVAVDVTAQLTASKNIEEREQKFRLLADSMPQHIWTADVDGNLNYYNQSVYDYSGLTQQQLDEKGWIQIVHPDDREENVKVWLQAVQTGHAFHFEHRFQRSDGAYRWQLSRAVPQRDDAGNIQMWVGTSTDIQEMKEMNQQKDDFISIASHEMKTPLATAKGYLQLLLLALNEENPTSFLYVTKANQAVDRLHNLVKELLDASKIQNGQLHYNISTFDFNEITEETIENMKLTTKNHRLQITGSCLHLVTGDKERLQQVLINLINNAIKYSPDAHEVIIHIEEQAGKIQVSVQDFGIGIPKHHLDKIFERYYRVEEQAAHFQGLGIGLFISGNIIHRHKGRLWAESEPGEGSTFYFTLPF